MVISFPGSTARALQRQHQTQPRIKLLETVRRQPTDALGEDSFVKSKELRDVDDRIAREASLAASKKNISRGKGQPCVRCNSGADDGVDSTRGEVIGLDDRYRPPVAGFGAGWLSQ